MANVHGFGGPPNNEGNNRGRGNEGNYQNLNAGVADEIPFMNSMKGDQRPPMDESIPYTLKILCCPDLKLLSTSLLLLLAIWVLYAVCLANGISTANQEVLEVSTSVLVDFGAALGTLVKEGQVHRLVTATFLHVNLLHILMNSISLLIFVTRFERIYPLLTPVILLVSSVTGFMLSVLCNRTTATVGASTAIFGVLGGFIAYLVINWVALEKYGPVRSTLTCVIGIIIVFSLLFSVGSSIDAIAHVGGLLGGLLMSLAVLPGMEGKNSIVTWVGVAGIVGMNLTTFLIFFLTE